MPLKLPRQTASKKDVISVTNCIHFIPCVIRQFHINPTHTNPRLSYISEIFSLHIMSVYKIQISVTFILNHRFHTNPSFSYKPITFFLT